MKLTVMTKCPYCGHGNYGLFERYREGNSDSFPQIRMGLGSVTGCTLSIFDKVVITCSLDDGGCDRDYIARCKQEVCGERENYLKQKENMGDEK